jgi:hypothetical protein
MREERREPRKIFGPERKQVTGQWRKLHNVELYDPYCSPNIIRAIKSNRMIWVGHVACMNKNCIKGFGVET